MIQEKCFSISGRVQGVGFRYWTVKTAQKIGNLSGYVMNADNGDVLVFVSGEDDAINKLQGALYQGPLFSRVDNIREAPELISFFPAITNNVFKRL